jgi:alkylhydroperoxidase family enzyme
VEGLHESGLSDEGISSLQIELDEELFSPEDLALLRLAEQLTLDPSAAEAATYEALAIGWSEREVAQAIFIVAYFNMVTRIADAFALPPDVTHPYDPDTVLPMLRCSEE